MAKFEFDLCTDTYVTKTAVTKRVREIMEDNIDLEPLTGDDFGDMCNLLSYHPQSEEKIGAGIDSIYINSADYFGGRCFYIKRTDGTEIDFSFRACITPPKEGDDFRKACREAISGDIQTFRNKNLKLVKTCPILGIPITYKTAHVDHAPPWEFEKIVKEFIKDRGIDITSVHIPLNNTPGKKYGTVTVFGDARMAEDFKRYHREKAVLRILSSKANLSLNRRKAQA